MATINHAERTIICKLVYYGTGMCGKTTNLQYLHGQLQGQGGGEMVSLATPGERTLYFDYLPVALAEIDGYRVKFGLYTVPGQVMYNATRKLVLRGADGIVFVADSQWKLMDDNLESLLNLQENLQEYYTSLDETPYVMQYNKRDMDGVAPAWYLNHLLNAHGVPAFESVASTGDGVPDTLYTLCRYVMRKLVPRLQAGLQ